MLVKLTCRNELAQAVLVRVATRPPDSRWRPAKAWR